MKPGYPDALYFITRYGLESPSGPSYLGNDEYRNRIERAQRFIQSHDAPAQPDSAAEQPGRTTT